MSAPFPGTGVPLEEHAARCKAVLDAIEGDVMILAAGSPPTYSRDTEYRFRPHSDFFYLTGYPEPETVLVLKPGAEAPVTLFVRPRDPEAEVWTGRRTGPEGAVRDYGVDAAHTLDELEPKMREILDGAQRIHHYAWEHPALDGMIRGALAFLRGKERFGHRAPSAIVDPGALLHEMRLVKSEAEIAVLREAARISAEGHLAGLSACRPGATEFQIQNAIESTFLQQGAPTAGYATIVGAGENGCILHYIENQSEIRKGQLVLVDAGAEFGGYNGDITRTFPSDGHFTPAQRAVYDIVLDALEKCLVECKPGQSIDGIHEIALRTLTQGLIDLGLIEGPLEDALEEKRFTKYYMHRTSHWLGMDVHDVGLYRQEDASRPLVPGMCFTVEPGIYIQAHDESAPSDLRGIGVRIEDDVVITAEGHENLTRKVPVAADEVAALVGRARHS